MSAQLRVPLLQVLFFLALCALFVVALLSEWNRSGRAHSPAQIESSSAAIDRLVVLGARIESAEVHCASSEPLLRLTATTVEPLPPETRVAIGPVVPGPNHGDFEAPRGIDRTAAVVAKEAETQVERPQAAGDPLQAVESLVEAALPNNLIDSTYDSYVVWLSADSGGVSLQSNSLILERDRLTC